MALESHSAFTMVPSVGGRSGPVHGAPIANSDGLSAMMAGSPKPVRAPPTHPLRRPDARTRVRASSRGCVSSRPRPRYGYLVWVTVQWHLVWPNFAV